MCMKYQFLFLLLGFAAAGNAQEKSPAENGVYLSDSDFLMHRLKDGFDHQKGNRLNDNKRDFLIVKTGNTRDTFYFDHIWGFRKDGVDLRVYGKEYYEVTFVNDKICLYDLPGTGQSEGIRSTHYFSESLSSPVRHLTRQNLLSVYHDNDSFTKRIKEMSFTRSIFRWDKKNSNYAFVSWL